jgi:hypothetical protein
VSETRVERPLFHRDDWHFARIKDPKSSIALEGYQKSGVAGQPRSVVAWMIARNNEGRCPPAFVVLVRAKAGGGLSQRLDISGAGEAAPLAVGKWGLMADNDLDLEWTLGPDRAGLEVRIDGQQFRLDSGRVFCVDRTNEARRVWQVPGGLPDDVILGDGDEENNRTRIRNLVEQLRGKHKDIAPIIPVDTGE